MIEKKIDDFNAENKNVYEVFDVFVAYQTNVSKTKANSIGSYEAAVRSVPAIPWTYSQGLGIEVGDGLFWEESHRR